MKTGFQLKYCHCESLEIRFFAFPALGSIIRRSAFGRTVFGYCICGDKKCAAILTDSNCFVVADSKNDKSQPQAGNQANSFGTQLWRRIVTVEIKAAMFHTS